jgi:chromosome segregation ATPase
MSVFDAPLAAVDAITTLLETVPTQGILVIMMLAGEAARRRLSKSIQTIDDEVDELSDHHEDLRNRVERVDTKQDQMAVRQERVLDKIGANTEDIRELEVDHVRQDHERFEREHGHDDGPDDHDQRRNGQSARSEPGPEGDD